MEELGEHIDKKYWLPDGVPIITPEREAKGDMLIERDISAEIRFAQAQVRNILNYLWHESYITDDHHDCGCIFEAWRNQHCVALGLQRAVSGEADASYGVKLRAYGYVLILKRINASDHKAIDGAITTFANPHTKDMAFKQRQTYRAAFERLLLVLTPIREQVAYLEGLSEAQRYEEERCALKNYIDGLPRKL